MAARHYPATPCSISSPHYASPPRPTPRPDSQVHNGHRAGGSNGYGSHYRRASGSRPHLLYKQTPRASRAYRLQSSCVRAVARTIRQDARHYPTISRHRHCHAATDASPPSPSTLGPPTWHAPAPARAHRSRSTARTPAPRQSTAPPVAQSRWTNSPRASALHNAVAIRPGYPKHIRASPADDPAAHAFWPDADTHARLISNRRYSLFLVLLLTTTAPAAPVLLCRASIRSMPIPRRRRGRGSGRGLHSRRLRSGRTSGPPSLERR